MFALLVIESTAVKSVFVVLAYLLGAIPTGYLLVKYVFARGEDIRRVGSGGTGATNVMRRAGWKAGLLTYVIDVLKGVAAVWLMGRAAGDETAWLGAAAVAAIFGHCYPVFLKFRGGKGVATGCGALLMLAPLSVAAALGVFIMAVALTRYVSLGSILGALTVPLGVWVFYGWLHPRPDIAPLLVTAIAAAVLIVARHHENIARLFAGRENRLGQRVNTSDAAARGGER